MADEERRPSPRPHPEYGKRAHGGWINERFASTLEGLGEAERKRGSTRFVVATDV